MTKQTRGSNRNGRKGDPNQDVQPLLGWLAALLVVVIVVVAVAMGMERTNNQRNSAAEVRMTPLVGGIEMPVATETGAAVAAASEVTPIPEAISETTGITMVNVITTEDTFTATGEMTPTETLTASEGITATEGMTATESLTSSAEITATEAVTDSVVMTESETPQETVTTAATATEEPTAPAEATATEEATAEATATAAPRPTATPRPTAVVDAPVLAAGDMVGAVDGRVEIYADASLDALVLDSFGTGVELEVLDPSGDYETYPVVVDGHGWARVRAADGLVGWVMTDRVEVQ